MTTMIDRVTGETIKRAIEARNPSVLASLYAEDAAIRIVDREHPPSKPRVVQGRTAIAAFFDDVCGRAMTHEVTASIDNADRLAFTQACSYPDGTRVLCIAMADLERGKIARQMIVQAWDE